MKHVEIRKVHRNFYFGIQKNCECLALCMIRNTVLNLIGKSIAQIKQISLITFC